MASKLLLHPPTHPPPHLHHHHHHHHHLGPLSTTKSPLQLPHIHLRRNLLPPIKSTSTPQFPPHPSLTNDDLLPVPPSQRTLFATDIASLWIGLVVSVPAYYLATSLVTLGASAASSLFLVTLANFLVLLPLVLSAIPGTRHGLPFPVLARATFGIHGAHIPSLLRGLVACGWFGIETWVGGQAIAILVPRGFPMFPAGEIAWLGTSSFHLCCFLVFWSAQLGVVLKGMEGVKNLERFSAPILIGCTILLLYWAYTTAGGFGPMLYAKSTLSTSQFWSLFFPSLTANISFWATLALNIPDFTRYAKTQKDQIIGQIGLPVFMGLFSFVGLAVTSASETIYGEIISNPIDLLSRMGGGTLPVALSILGVSLATLTTNIAANVVAPANALVNLNPRWFNFEKAAVATAVVGLLIQPWRLMKNSESFIYTWLVGYSALLGPIGGIMIVDYYLVKKMELVVDGLYSLDSNGPYWYNGGVNVNAVVALVVGVSAVIPGFLNKVGVVKGVGKVFVMLYNSAWFVSFFLAGLVYWCLSMLKGDKRGKLKL